jgi:hypothetical protein
VQKQILFSMAWVLGLMLLACNLGSTATPTKPVAPPPTVRPPATQPPPTQTSLQQALVGLWRRSFVDSSTGTAVEVTEEFLFQQNGSYSHSASPPYPTWETGLWRVFDEKQGLVVLTRQNYEPKTMWNVAEQRWKPIVMPPEWTLQVQSINAIGMTTCSVVLDGSIQCFDWNRVRQ